MPSPWRLAAITKKKNRKKKKKGHPVTAPAKPSQKSDQPTATDSPHPQADDQFLRRILFGLVTATVVTGAVAAGLTAQHLRPDLVEIASLWGPA